MHFTFSVTFKFLSINCSRLFWCFLQMNVLQKKAQISSGFFSLFIPEVAIKNKTAQSQTFPSTKRKTLHQAPSFHEFLLQMRSIWMI